MGFLFWLVLLAFIIILAVLTIFVFKYQKETLNNIKDGSFDLELFYNYLKERNKSKIKIISKKTFKIAANIIFAAIFVSGCYLFITNYFNVSTYKVLVVATNSMSFKNESNTYLYEDNLNNQFSANDIVFVKKVKSISELQVYDVISYLNEDNINIIHRIIAINGEEIITRGDANNTSDEPISFKQVVGVYTNFKIPKLGLVVFFLQSYYGYLCVFGIFYALVIYSVVDSKITKLRMVRLNYLKDLVGNRTSYTLVSKEGSLVVEGASVQLILEKNTISETKIK